MSFFLAFLMHLHQEPVNNRPSLYRLSVAKEVAASLPAAGGGAKGRRSVCSGRQGSSLLCQATIPPGTANEDGLLIQHKRYSTFILSAEMI